MSVPKNKAIRFVVSMGLTIGVKLSLLLLVMVFSSRVREAINDKVVDLEKLACVFGYISLPLFILGGTWWLLDRWGRGED